MPYEQSDLYSSRHADLLQALKSRAFPSTGEWAPLVSAARQLVVDDGFDVTKYEVCVSMRKKVGAARKKGTTPAVLNAGLKKIAACIRSTFLIFTDMPKDRGDVSQALTTAFVFKNEKVDVVYVEAAFSTDADLFKDLKNWTRIVVHELSHREAKTDDNRYRHHAKGLKPDAGDATFTAAKALANADSWAMFCMDCAGWMLKGDYLLVKV